jgi:hypothetical protein
VSYETDRARRLGTRARRNLRSDRFGARHEKVQGMHPISRYVRAVRC